MKPFHKHFIAAFGLIAVLAITPTSAFARGSVQIHIPGISIGVYDDHGYKHRKRSYKKRYSKKRYNNNYNNRRYNNNYYNNRRYNNNNSYYNDRRYNNSYNGRNNYYNDGYRSQRCPADGYSSYYDRNRNCYEHNGHFHCS